MKFRSCVRPEGQFVFGIHKPCYTVDNRRNKTVIQNLGHFESGDSHSNAANYPSASVTVDDADWIYEIPNPFPFRGSTYIDKEWAEANVNNPQRICLPLQEDISFTDLLNNEGLHPSLLEKLPDPLLLALATTSTDPADLRRLAEISCSFEKDSQNIPIGLSYKKSDNTRIRAIIHNHPLFEAVANNPLLPASYQKAMVLRPGAQGNSEIVGEFENSDCHVYEYLRKNSYIANGHYAANMADDAIRYSIERLTFSDITGLRHLYYQRTFLRLADLLGIECPTGQRQLSNAELETLRKEILSTISNGLTPEFSSTLWGWNFGFDYAPSGYRLHASHQQIHQQYAMLPEFVEQFTNDSQDCHTPMHSFGCGDMVTEVVVSYNKETDSDFFTDYLRCIRNNVRMDGKSGEGFEASLILWEDQHAILFVPKAQTSQWELQLMALKNSDGKSIENILAADSCARNSLNLGIFLAQKALAGLGAKMVTSIEYPKRLTGQELVSQHLLYSFLPRLPESPGAFSEAQLRFINGHYPEDFATACRRQLLQVNINVQSCSCGV
jgi:hypothetical protein